MHGYAVDFGLNQKQALLLLVFHFLGIWCPNISSWKSRRQETDVFWFWSFSSYCTLSWYEKSCHISTNINYSNDYHAIYVMHMDTNYLSYNSKLFFSFYRCPMAHCWFQQQTIVLLCDIVFCSLKYINLACIYWLKMGCLHNERSKFPPWFNFPCSIDTNTRLPYWMEKCFQYFLYILRALRFNFHKETIFAWKYVINSKILFFITLVSEVSFDFEAKNINKVKALNEACYRSNKRAVIRLAIDYLVVRNKWN